MEAIAFLASKAMFSQSEGHAHFPVMLCNTPIHLESASNVIQAVSHAKVQPSQIVSFVLLVTSGIP